VGTIWRTGEHCCLWIGAYSVRLYHGIHVLCFSNVYHICCFLFRLTASKDAGESIEIDGKKVALGIPQPKKAPEPASLFESIPLGRGGTPDEAAAAMLLCVLSPAIFALQWLMCVLQLTKASHRRFLRIYLAIPSKLQVEGASNYYRLQQGLSSIRLNGTCLHCIISHAVITRCFTRSLTCFQFLRHSYTQQTPIKLF